MIQIYIVDASAVINDEWTHITATYDCSETKKGLSIYVNGLNNTESHHENGS
ncbi:MAG: LamG-like jellyroll fold domain-containing protein [Candidatus Thorarchaeota archaeon]